MTSFAASKLKNGMNIVTYHMPYVESVAINLIVGIGSRYEDNNESGISHFLEHMAFKGTKTRSAKDIAEAFDLIGGNFNAYTSRERTVFYAKVLKNHFNEALDIIADIIQNSIFAQEDIDKECQVILQELAGVLDDPDEFVHEKLYDIAFPEQPMGNSILGNINTLTKINKQSFLNYLNKYYVANNMCLSVAGNIAHKVVEKHAESLFIDLQNKNIENYISAKYVGGSLVINKDLEQTNMLIGFKSFSYMDIKEFYTSQILSLILGGGSSSRLFQSIRENRGLAYSIGSYITGYADCGLLTIYISCNHKKLPECIEALKVELIKIASNVTVNELQKANNQIKTNLHLAEEKSSYKSESIGKNYMIFGKYIGIEIIDQIITSITSDDIIACAKRIFATKASVILLGKFDTTMYDQYKKIVEDFRVI